MAKIIAVKSGYGRKRGTRTPYATRLQSLTGPVYALGAENFNRMRNDTYVAHLNRRGKSFLEKQKTPLWAIEQYQAEMCRLKVSAKQGRTLLYFDLDTHAFGSSDDVRLMAMVIRDCLPQCSEFVFSERGGSGWLLVDNGMLLAEEYNVLVRRLEVFFQSVCKGMGLDVEYVEVKGKIAELSFSHHKCSSVKAGDLMKAPPSIEFMSGEVVDARIFADPRFDPWPEEEQDKNKRKQGSSSGSSGSFHPRLVTEEIESRIPELVEFVKAQFPDRPLSADRWAITDRQFAEVLLTLVLLKPNADGSNPYARHEAFICELHKAGVFSHAYNHHRYKAVRDYLSSKGAIHWVDANYRPGFVGEKGQSCKWHLDPVLIAQVEMCVGLLEVEEDSGYTLVDTDTAYTGQNRRPHWNNAPIRLSEWHFKEMDRYFTGRIAA
jgi:hypothetical protein